MPACGGSTMAPPSTLKRLRGSRPPISRAERSTRSVCARSRASKARWMPSSASSVVPQGSVKDRVAQLKKDLSYPLTEDGRTQIMARCRTRSSATPRTRAASQFDRAAESAGRRAALPRFREANAAASYTRPRRDGSRPGTFQIPLRPERMTKFGLRTLVYHETVPGHHFQVALELENDAPAAVPSDPRVRRASRRSARAGASTPSGWRPNQAGTKATSKGCSASSTPRSSARAGWSSTPVSTRSAGRASRRSTTASKRAKSSATS